MHASFSFLLMFCPTVFWQKKSQETTLQMNIMMILHKVKSNNLFVFDYCSVWECSITFVFFTIFCINRHWPKSPNKITVNDYPDYIAWVKNNNTQGFMTYQEKLTAPLSVFQDCLVRMGSDRKSPKRQLYKWLLWNYFTR